MKITFKAFIFQFALLFALQANADDKETKNAKSFEWVIFPSKDGKLRVNINNHKRERMLVLIKCQEGETVHKNYVGRTRVKTAINYDLSELKDGDYKVLIYIGDNVEIKDFHIGPVATFLPRHLTVY
ncbi:hypothetical protein [Dyadobacter arcticus]|uniref:Uncharacterized protein n=1 Tax=Dyadobacter arcticus TaxID=1078754 RepID=A0ABX0US61_9BACT|nr:hypothetical protein [Dyadobacter arcticus]NIJ54470.1 hypothetical protein [Dyadobacter arcticus]